MPEVIIYSTKTCPYCQQAKELLDSKHLRYTDYPVDEEPHLRDIMVEKSGRKTVPQIFIAGEHVGGCSDLFALEHSGELDRLLTQIGEENG